MYIKLQPSKSQSGFSIIEVLVGSFILTVGILAVFSLLFQSQTVASVKKQEATATQILTETIETIRAAKPADVSDLTIIPIASPRVLNGTSYNIEIITTPPSEPKERAPDFEVNPTPSTTLNYRLLECRVSVSWNSGVEAKRIESAIIINSP